MSEKVLIALGTFCESGRRPLDELEASGRPFVINPHKRRLVPEEIVELGRDCAGIVAGVEPYTREVLEALPELRVVSRCGVGVDNVDLHAARERGVAVRNTPDVVVQPVAEMTLAVTLDLMRRLSVQTAAMKAGRWEKHAGSLLAGKTVGVVGLGRIGRRVAEIFAALGANVVGVDPMCNPDWADRAGVGVCDLAHLLEAADVVSVHVAAPLDAPFRLGAAEFAAMRPGAYFVNIARGTYVDEDALYDALASGHLAGAGLDVFSAEPYTGRLLELENLVCTPHVATLTHESRLRMEVEAVLNCLDSLDSR